MPRTLRKLVSSKRFNSSSYIHGVTSQKSITAMRTSDSGQGWVRSNVKLGTVVEACCKGKVDSTTGHEGPKGE